ncbi:MAG: outer membrane beta-barrel protein [Desulfuromonadaceae bacterium]|nr:outer membrane beta-barrel protein [Desulfuromonadaceae bacterium]
MKKQFIILAALATLVIPTVCMATPPRPGPYVSGFIGVNFPQNADVASYDYYTGDSFNDRVEFDPGINIGGTGGFDFGFVRLEGEMSYKHGEMTTITDLSGVRYRNIDGNLGVLAMMGNMFFDLRNPSPITPYVGGGIGLAVMHLSDTFGTSTFDNTRPLLYREDDDAVFAYQVGAGLEIALNRALSLDLGYRYFATSKARFDSNNDIATDLKFKSHNAAIGFRVKF